jgi:hypothetical protein
MQHKPHEVHGDWRDLHAALEAAVPGYAALSNGERKPLWDLGSAVIANYAPLKAQCIECRQVVPWSAAYRCADCGAVLCGEHIRPHFGPNHKRHG